MSKKYCYLFTEGNAKMRELLGGKGANLAEMTNIGLPVPQGFTITTEACTQYYEDGRQINDAIMAEIMEYIEKMEQITGKKFGDHENPLLVSVRSGARASMPGMMDTILNLGLNEDVVDVIAKKSNNPRWAWDCYRRFIQMYSDVVMEVGKKYFEQLIDAMKEQKGVTQDVELDAADLKAQLNRIEAQLELQDQQNRGIIANQHKRMILSVVLVAVILVVLAFFGWRINMAYNNVMAACDRVNALADTVQTSLDTLDQSQLDDMMQDLPEITEQLKKIDVDALNKVLTELPALMNTVSSLQSQVESITNWFNGLGSVFGR